VALCDSNVWLALALSKHVYHASVCDWFDGVDEPASVCFCRATQQTFLRLLTKASVLSPYGNPPLTNRRAWAIYRELIADDRIFLRVDEPAGLEAHWVRFAARDSASPKVWMDAYLAAFALAGGYRMVTTDTAFSQFPGLDLELLGNRA
jgi:toxin-antitoxin system PIN domain toxin